MFKPGDYIVYGISGVCLVEDICDSPFGIAEDRRYYLLKPLGAVGSSTIYAPVDNDKVGMRPLLSRDAALNLLDRLTEAVPPELPSGKPRRDLYRGAIATMDPLVWAGLLKTLLKKSNENAGISRRLSETDMEYLHTTLTYLGTELSLALGIPFVEAKERVLKGLQE